MPSNYVDQHWPFANCTLGNKFQWHYISFKLINVYWRKIHLKSFAESSACFQFSGTYFATIILSYKKEMVNVIVQKLFSLYLLRVCNNLLNNLQTYLIERSPCLGLGIQWCLYWQYKSNQLLKCQTNCINGSWLFIWHSKDMLYHWHL